MSQRYLELCSHRGSHIQTGDSCGKDSRSTHCAMRWTCRPTSFNLRKVGQLVLQNPEWPSAGNIGVEVLLFSVTIPTAIRSRHPDERPRFSRTLPTSSGIQTATAAWGQPAYQERLATATPNIWRSRPHRSTSRTIHLPNQLFYATLWHTYRPGSQALHIDTLVATPSRLSRLSVFTPICPMVPPISAVLDQMFLGDNRPV